MRLPSTLPPSFSAYSILPISRDFTRPARPDFPRSFFVCVVCARTAPEDKTTSSTTRAKDFIEAPLYQLTWPSTSGIIQHALLRVATDSPRPSPSRPVDSPSPQHLSSTPSRSGEI